MKQWENDLIEAKALAKESKKYLIINVHMGWCQWCLKFHEETLPSTEAQSVLENLVCLSALAEDADGKRTPNYYLAKAFRVYCYPMFIIFDAAGDEVGRFAGFYTPKGFVSQVNKVLSHK